MATVTGFTAERMQEIEDSTVVDGMVDINGHLILIKRDTSTIDAGLVQGEQGLPGTPGTPGAPGAPGADADFGGYVEPLDDRGNVSGAVSLNFATHNVWRIVPTGAVTLTFTNLPASGFVAPGTLIVANSSFAITWPVGTKFPGGVAPVLSGETILSILGRSTGITVGVAWSGVA